MILQRHIRRTTWFTIGNADKRASILYQQPFVAKWLCIITGGHYHPNLTLTCMSHMCTGIPFTRRRLSETNEACRMACRSIAVQLHLLGLLLPLSLRLQNCKCSDIVRTYCKFNSMDINLEQVTNSIMQQTTCGEAQALNGHNHGCPQTDTRMHMGPSVYCLLPGHTSSWVGTDATTGTTMQRVKQIDK